MIAASQRQPGGRLWGRMPRFPGHIGSLQKWRKGPKLGQHIWANQCKKIGGNKFGHTNAKRGLDFRQTNAKHSLQAGGHQRVESEGRGWQ